MVRDYLCIRNIFIIYGVTIKPRLAFLGVSIYTHFEKFDRYPLLDVEPSNMMTPRACIELDLSALWANLQRIRQHVAPARVLAVLKANAYGHGLITIAQALEEADGLAVALVGEAVQLRQAGCRQRLLCLKAFCRLKNARLALNTN